MIALVLATVGTYGVMAFHVDQARREIGIRLALGASNGRILAGFVRRGMTLVGLGLAIGMAVAVASTRLIGTLLFGLSPTDVVTFSVMPALLAVTALVATADSGSTRHAPRSATHPAFGIARSLARSAVTVIAVRVGQKHLDLPQRLQRIDRGRP